MYKFHRNQQMSFTDFNQPAGMQMDPENRWVKKAAYYHRVPADILHSLGYTEKNKFIGANAAVSDCF